MKLYLFLSIHIASGSLTETEQFITHVNWSDDHEFLSPNEIYTNAVGLLFCLTTRRLINISFTDLYQRR